MAKVREHYLAGFWRMRILLGNSSLSCCSVLRLFAQDAPSGGFRFLQVDAWFSDTFSVLGDLHTGWDCGTFAVPSASSIPDGQIRI